MTRLTRRTTLAGIAAAGVFSPAIVRAQGAYPAGQTIKMVVPYPAGGATDIVGRVVADALAEVWKVTIVVENISGAAANVGMDRVAKGPTDGTTLFVVPPQIAINQFLYSKLSYDPEKDLVPVSQVSGFSNLLCVKKGMTDIKTVQDLIDFAKKNPGKLNFASSGNGTTIHLSAELFKRMVGIDMVHVAYRGSALALQDLVGGQVDLMFDNLPSIYPQAKEGNVRGLAVTQPTKSRFAPEYPTVAETVPGYDVQSWFGIGVRSGISAEIVKKIETDVVAVCKTATVRDRLNKVGMETIGSSQAEFGQWIEIERKRWGNLIGELKLKVD
jgi:tripartite-type tricarboxylate transporter receptor subunit TctC